MFKGMVFGSLISTLVCIMTFNLLTKDDMEIMLDQNELLNQQQELILDIRANCDNRNWISFEGEVYVCMHVNKMFRQLSHPPVPNFKFPDENEA